MFAAFVRTLPALLLAMLVLASLLVAALAMIASLFTLVELLLNATLASCLP